jgi:hypothetical protein
MFNALSLTSRTYLVGLAVIVTAFVALYSHLNGMGSCGVGECPYAARSSHAGSAGLAATACVGAVLAAEAAAAVAFAAFRGRRLLAADPRPTEIYLSPDPPPPRSFLSL